jgi:enoyl-[acyl-carrier-protein] reductase (NADH)
LPRARSPIWSRRRIAPALPPRSTEGVAVSAQIKPVLTGHKALVVGFAIMDVGFACACLATDFARRITGGTIYVDGGANVLA